MNVEEFREFCLQFPESEETLPFDESTLCFKTAGKIFAIIDLNDPDSVNLKAAPEQAITWREFHSDAVFPGFHMNKTHWNTVHFNLSVPDRLIREMVSHSWIQVVSGMPKKKKEVLLQQWKEQ